MHSEHPAATMNDDNIWITNGIPEFVLLVVKVGEIHHRQGR